MLCPFSLTWLPFSKKEEVQAEKKGEELIVRVGSMKRILFVPTLALGLDIVETDFDEKEKKLMVRFGRKGAWTVEIS